MQVGTAKKLTIKSFGLCTYTTPLCASFLMRNISIRGARKHNLKNIDLDIPRNQLVVIKGKTGSHRLRRGGQDCSKGSF